MTTPPPPPPPTLTSLSLTTLCRLLCQHSPPPKLRLPAVVVNMLADQHATVISALLDKHRRPSILRTLRPLFTTEHIHELRLTHVDDHSARELTCIHFPALQHLHLIHCPHLTNLVTCAPLLSSLTSLFLERCPRLSVHDLVSVVIPLPPILHLYHCASIYITDVTNLLSHTSLENLIVEAPSTQQQQTPPHNTPPTPTNIHDLSIHVASIHPSIIQSLLHSPTLVHLSLSMCTGITNHVLHMIATSGGFQLQSLNLSHTDLVLVGKEDAIWCQFLVLGSLNLDGIKLLDPTALDSLHVCPKLVKLDISSTFSSRKINEYANCLIPILSWQQMETLVLSRNIIADQVFSMFHEQSWLDISLVHLNLNGCHRIVCPTPLLGVAPRLETLMLSDTSVSSTFLGLLVMSTFRPACTLRRVELCNNTKLGFDTIDWSHLVFTSHPPATTPRRAKGSVIIDMTGCTFSNVEGNHVVVERCDWITFIGMPSTQLWRRDDDGDDDDSEEESLWRNRGEDNDGGGDDDDADPFPDAFAGDSDDDDANIITEQLKLAPFACHCPICLSNFPVLTPPMTKIKYTKKQLLDVKNGM